MSLPTLIEEFNWLDEKIHFVSERYERKFGVAPINVSHWNPSEETRRALSPLVTTPPIDVINYFYSYTLRPEELLGALGFQSQLEKFCLLTPGGTATMLIAVKLLQIINIRTLYVMCPFYFPLKYQCESLGVDTRYQSMERHCGAFKLPPRIPSSLADGEALWITSPVYCTGVYLQNEDIDRLRSFLGAGGIVIADESLSLRGRELSASLGDFSTFIGIYSPHKALSLNGLKFSALVTDKRYDVLLDSWADVLYGALAASSVAATKHFMSPDFVAYEQSFLDLIGDAALFLRGVAKDLHNIELDTKASGHYVTCYFPHLSAELGNDSEFLWRTSLETGAIFMAGTRNHLDPSWGLNFRINLALDGPQFRAAVIRLLNFLAAT